MNKFIIIALLFYSAIGFAQKEQEFELLDADSTWFREVIEFPIKFAREIPYKGFADLRFAPGFTKEESPELWSYVWAWFIKDVKHISAKQLENDIELYFDGLLGLNPEYHKDVKQQTTALFIKSNIHDNNTKFVGKVKTYDTRYTKKPLVLNVQVEYIFCKEENKMLLLFRYSPQNFENDIWKKLMQIQLKSGICN